MDTRKEARTDRAGPLLYKGMQVTGKRPDGTQARTDACMGYGLMGTIIGVSLAAAGLSLLVDHVSIPFWGKDGLLPSLLVIAGTWVPMALFVRCFVKDRRHREEGRDA